MSFLKDAICEQDGTPSSTRIALWIIVAVISGLAIYFIAANALESKQIDCPRNLADLLSVAIGSLSASRIAGRFAESPRSPSPRSLRED